MPGRLAGVGASSDATRRNEQLPMKIVVIGGAGLIGAKTVAVLRQASHEVVAASRRTGINIITGEGLAEAMVSAQVLIDLSNPPPGAASPIDFLEIAGRTLLAAGARPAFATM